MGVQSDIVSFLKESNEFLKSEEIFVFESSNGFVLASSSTDNTDIESIGSLSSGSITAMNLLFSQFGQSKLEYQAVVTDNAKLLFRRVYKNYFLLIVANNNIKIGFLNIKAQSVCNQLEILIKKFTEENEIAVSEVDIDDIADKLDAVLDKLMM